MGKINPPAGKQSRGQGSIPHPVPHGDPLNFHVCTNYNLRRDKDPCQGFYPSGNGKKVPHKHLWESSWENFFVAGTEMGSYSQCGIPVAIPRDDMFKVNS